MAGRRRRSGGNGLDAWPGYVDALSTLLMVIIFVLLVFVLAQGFLSVALSGRDKALDQVHRQLAALSDMLSLERGKATDMGLSVARLTRELDAANIAGTEGAQELTGLRAAAGKLTAERDALRREKSAAGDQATDANLQSQAASIRLAEQTRALTALRDELEKQAREAAARSLTEQQLHAAVALQLTDEKKLGDSARAEIALLNRQMDELRIQMAQVERIAISHRGVRIRSIQTAAILRNKNKRHKIIYPQKVSLPTQPPEYDSPPCSPQEAQASPGETPPDQTNAHFQP